MGKLKKEYKTKGKNSKMLRKLKKNLNESLHLYLNKKNKKEVKENIGKMFLKLAELSVIRYRWNSSGKLGIDVENIRGEIAYKLWNIVCEKKFNLKRLKDENSVYNFFMMSANNMAKYEIRRQLNREGKIHFFSLDQLLNLYGNGEGYGNLVCEDFFRSDKIF